MLDLENSLQNEQENIKIAGFYIFLISIWVTTLLLIS